MNGVRAGFVLALMLAAAPAQAHTRGASYSDWQLSGEGAHVRARVPQLELTRLALDPDRTPDYAARAGATVARLLQLTADGQPCAPGPVTAYAAAGWLHLDWTVRCGPGARAVESALLRGVAPGHLHFARVTLADGGVRARVLTAAAPVLALPAEAPTTLGAYVVLGLDHILSGWDHLAFVLALLLLAGSLREILVVVTGFTLAHSLTLALAALGLAQVQDARVEAVIGFSIALAAVEFLWQGARRAWMPAALLVLLALGTWRLPAALTAGLALFTACYFALRARDARPARLRAAMALMFGLAHGFGFAGALAELRLPPEALLVGLLGFNAGVELGQLLVIGVGAPLLWLSTRWPAARAWALPGAAAGLCAVGTYAFVVRAFA